MPIANSNDLRLEIVDAVQQGQKRRDVAKPLKVSPSGVIKRMQRFEVSSDVASP